MAEQESRDAEQAWLTPGVRGIGLASLLADVGHEVPTALLPGFLTTTLGASAAALGTIEGVSDGLAGAARLVGGALADDPERRRQAAIGGYASTAILSSLIGVTTSVWQVGALRASAWTARGLRVPARNALLADVVPRAAYGRAYGFERSMDNLGAILGPALALGLVALTSARVAILVSVIPGLAAVLAILYAIRHTPRPQPRERTPIRLRVRPVMHGTLGRLLIGISLFEAGNLAATLLILRATQLLTPRHGHNRAVELALVLYILYNAAATVVSIPAGRLGDRHGQQRVLTAGIASFAIAYLGLALTGANIAALAALFIAAGIGIACAETAEHAAVATLAPQALRGSAFGLLAGIQSIGNVAASTIAGVLWTLTSPRAAFLYATTCTLIALAVTASQRHTAAT